MVTTGRKVMGNRIIAGRTVGNQCKEGVTPTFKSPDEAKPSFPHMGAQKSYAQAVQQGIKGKHQLWRIKQSGNQDKWSGLSFSVVEEHVEWLRGCWVGRLRDLT
uniref:Uncharacterized protein n=1 Tax=Cajanus cajan TaxID=3821 RepID=A0A151QPV1_CAJCA|nr:hypothetical protein KK1_047025 [Cajanus cajan]